MRSAYVRALGDVDQISYGELPDPHPGERQVLVRVQAVAVDSVDTLVRSGHWSTEVRFPLAVGRDLVGTIVARGPRVTRFAAGDRVWTNSAGYGGRPGATAELVPVDEDRLYRLPAGADPVAFVASVHPGATAYGVLVLRARVQPGESVAVIGANGAVGMCLVQLAAQQGAEVIAVTRHAGASTRLRDLGAHQVVIAEARDAARTAVDAAPRGIDVLVDTTGQVPMTAVPEQLNPRGRIVVIAGRGTTELDLWRLYTREIQVLSFVMSRMTVSELAAAATWINASHPARPLTVGIGEVLRFADAARAHATVEARALPRLPDGIVGRLVLQP